MQITTRTTWILLAIRLGLAAVASTFAATSGRAQTYYYYPQTTPSQPVVTTRAPSRPVYYWPTTYQTQPSWNGHTTQYYQPTYTTPTYQPSYSPQYYQVAQAQPAAQVTYVEQPVETNSAGVPVVRTSFEMAGAAQSAVAQPDATAQPAAAAVAASDPYGFLGWLNSTRAAYGLPAVGYDPNLESWAAMNNNEQAARGMGHFVMGPARRQNSAMGGFPGVESMWMASPAHRAALLDPTIRWIGIAGMGAYWTFNVRHGI